jgi:DNA-directed RNA polymerase specialized sigma24 family protein
MAPLGRIGGALACPNPCFQILPMHLSSSDPALSSSQTLISRLGQGDDQAATDVFTQYFERMVRLAQRRQSPDLRARFDAEDVAQSALRTFFGRAQDGQFEITCAEDLWHLLATITLRKLSYQTRLHRSKKRTVRRETTPGTNGHGAAAAVEVTAPDAASLLVDQLDHLLRKMPEQYQQMVLLRIQGHTVPAIAELLGCCERTVFRALERFGELAREANSE